MTDSKGYFYIDNTCTYSDLMGMVAEETTSPRGVESKLQVGGSDGDYFLFYWQPGGRRMILEHSSSIEDVVYNLYLYASDYNYRISDYKSNEHNISKYKIKQ